jgi:cytochrome c oxidase subunit 3
MAAHHLAEQFDTLERQAQAARLGMWAFLASEALLFAGLFTLYAAYRTMYGHDFAAASPHNNLFLGTTNTVVLITSSFTVAMSVHAVRSDRPSRAAWLLTLSVALGAVFLVLKGIEYAQHIHEGAVPGPAYHMAELPTFGANVFFGLYWSMTGLHALHVTVGMAVLAFLAHRTRAGAYSAQSHTAVELGGLYWHLVDIIWIFLWPLLYLAR